MRIPVRDFNHQLEKVVGCKAFYSSLDEDHKVAWSQNSTVYKTWQILEENEELGQIRFPVTLFFTLVQLCVTFYGP